MHTQSQSTNEDILIFTCAGAAHAGQVANRAGVKLTEEAVGQLFCTAAVAARIADKLERTQKARNRVAIDGCEDHCCRRVLEDAGFSVDAHVVVTDLGIDKQSPDPHLLLDAIRVVVDVKKMLAGGTPRSAGSAHYNRGDLTIREAKP